ncbi:membrane protein [Fulvitalea axinellae]|uniref:Membrane protein n=1 Tax=Fulvitalea axinellae TaxID=1182444 RepID=A0AAU9CHV1_9BACT|nr:membrane protein [Fulvitalea axinellae]
MELTLTTPALLFPAISLLFLSYTNKFLTIAGLIRSLYSEYKESPDKVILDQLNNLRRRVVLIKYMQALGVGSFIFCVLDMFLLFNGKQFAAEVVFGISLLLLLASLIICITEIQISSDALKLQLHDMEDSAVKRSH